MLSAGKNADRRALTQIPRRSQNEKQRVRVRPPLIADPPLPSCKKTYRGQQSPALSNDRGYGLHLALALELHVVCRQDPATSLDFHRFRLQVDCRSLWSRSE